MMPRTIKKILIANRGEIAIRVIRACRDMNIPAVAVFSECDKTAYHVQMADEAYHIGPAPSTESYLVHDKIIGAAKRSGADAIHPGYGFLAENAEFAQRCADEGVVFTCCPPAPEARIVSIRISVAGTSMSTSSASGKTATVAAEV